MTAKKRERGRQGEGMRERGGCVYYLEFQYLKLYFRHKYSQNLVFNYKTIKGDAIRKKRMKEISQKKKKQSKKKQRQKKKQ